MRFRRQSSRARRTPEQDVLTWQVAFVYLQDQPRHQETGLGPAEELLQDSEHDFCGGRNILSSLEDASGQKGTIMARQARRKNSVWFGLKLFSFQEIKWHTAPSKEVCPAARSYLWI